ncbi:hypothetical protein AR457_26500 [Streptomyces agglomeratus]|uniref:hypothetical protein n=1 Tax=Streptomyces agglomeratus TaxID=285458 RepID=UPI0008540AA9|nr:hypothetical protein [Streptomyces agglomeratus]OEJ38458.1 hypothetical protein BGK70_10155 [Streptomyces agglomeratus]OEJ47157.1 hypothetical protein AR457_26500 [Streptomyces agglomeratus]OEJ50986.1 hypothetical protein BGK72_09640 [Streptomyces agglomeratus]OEJ58356.1 hypothetical protein BGM19_10550 [Streptomyces agglomeratus]
MPQTTLASPSRGLPPVPSVRLRAALRAAAVISCVPYVALKIAWIAGSRIGIPDGSVLLDHPGLVAAANGVTVLMDAAVVVLALLLTQDWGRRVPAWLLALPMWVATGLLTPIVTGFPLQVLAKVFTGARSAPAGSEPFLAEWVFAIVYTGFIVQGLALGTLFALYARERWGHLWRGPIRELPGSAVGPRLRAAGVAAAVLAGIVAVPHAMWAAGATTGLNRGRIEGRTADFYLLEGTYVLFAAVTAAGVLALVLRRGHGRSPRTPLALAWVGSAALGCWGGWLLTAGALPVTDAADRSTTLMLLTYAVQMITGLLVLGAGASFLRARGQLTGGRVGRGQGGRGQMEQGQVTDGQVTDGHTARRRIRRRDA